MCLFLRFGFEKWLWLKMFFVEKVGAKIGKDFRVRFREAVFSAGVHNVAFCFSPLFWSCLGV